MSDIKICSPDATDYQGLNVANEIVGQFFKGSFPIRSIGQQVLIPNSNGIRILKLLKKEKPQPITWHDWCDHHTDWMNSY